MYEIALSVAACLRAGTRVDVAWVVDTQGITARDKGEALAITPGGGRVGAALSGALNDQLADLCEQGSTGRLVDLRVGPLEAELAGLPGGGDARCLLVPATDLPSGLWERLRERDPVCLLTRLDADSAAPPTHPVRVVDIAMFGPEAIADAGEDAARLFGRGVSDTKVTADTVTTVLWPVPKLVIIGAGAVADALCRAAELLGWHPQVITEVGTATGVIAGLAVPDKLVVISHDHELAGPALAAALSGPVGYIGALGSRRMQESRADWLAYRGVTDLERIHGPAGLDIGANTSAEIAVSIVAQAVAVSSKANAGSLGEKTGSIH